MKINYLMEKEDGTASKCSLPVPKNFIRLSYFWDTRLIGISNHYARPKSAEGSQLESFEPNNKIDRSKGGKGREREQMS